MDVSHCFKVVPSGAFWAMWVVVDFGDMFVGRFRLFRLIVTDGTGQKRGGSLRGRWDDWGIGPVQGVVFAVAFVGPTEMLSFSLFLVVLGPEEGEFVGSDGIGVFIGIVPNPC